MRHLLLIDPLERLAVAKDSSLLLALALKESGREARVLLREDVHLVAGEGPASPPARLPARDFSGSWDPGDFSVTRFDLGEPEDAPLDRGVLLHMRLDPPFDAGYLRLLWILDALSRTRGVRVMNAPRGLLLRNEKLCALGPGGADATPTFAGSAPGPFLAFCARMRRAGHREVVVKPLDLYQGLGVERLPLDGDDTALGEAFRARASRAQGALIAQPFLPEVLEGEVRSIHFKGGELGSILKVPAPGDFLANVARGASFRPHEPSRRQREACRDVARSLARDGIDWIAFDLIGDAMSEVNTTCPGLLVETSRALGRNLALKMAESLP